MIGIRLIIVAMLLIVPVYSVAEPICKPEILIKNQTGNLKFGAMHEPPKGSDYSVWFPIVPQSLAFDSLGNVYVGDSVKYRIMKFDKNGKFLLKFPLQRAVRTKKPELSHEIRSIAVDKDDNLYVLNILEYRVEIYSPTGKFLRQIDYFKDEIDMLNTNKPRNRFKPGKVSVDPSGNVYLLGSADKNNIPYSGAIYDSHGKLNKKGVAWGINYQESMMVGSSGYDYDLDLYSPDKKLPENRFFAFKIKDKQGVVVKECGGIGSEYLAIDESGPAIHMDRNGNLYSFDNSEDVIKILSVK